MKNAFKLGAVALFLSASMVACKGSGSSTTTDSTKKDSTVAVDSTVKTDSVKKDSTVKVDSTKKDTTKKM